MDESPFNCRDLEISVSEAKALLDEDERTIPIDIRGSREIMLGYIRGARFVAPGLIEGESDKLSADRNAPIIVYCAVGDRSISAASRLRQMGFTNARVPCGRLRRVARRRRSHCLGRFALRPPAQQVQQEHAPQGGG